MSNLPAEELATKARALIAETLDTLTELKKQGWECRVTIAATSIIKPYADITIFRKQTL